MKRSTPMRRTALARGTSKLARTKLRTTGRRAKAQQTALAKFRADCHANAGGRCERCGSANDLHAHHLVSRARGAGRPWLHDAAANGALLCGTCHAAVHAACVTDWQQWVRRTPVGLPW